MRERRDKIVKISLSGILAIHILFLLPGYIFAQGGSGRSATAVKRPAVFGEGQRKRTRSSIAKNLRGPSPIVPTIIPVEIGRLALMVNQGGSQMFLSRTGSLEKPELISVPSNVSTLILRSLPVGSYNLLVKKNGFFDETRAFDITKGKRRRVEINLKPMMAILTVAANVADAQISIENVGKFTRPLRKFFVKPGVYRINVQRRGYLSQTFTLDLKNPGQEQVTNVVLQPLRINSVIALASESIKSGNYTTAAELTNDILLLNPLHAKANLLYGLIEFDRGEISASSYFLKAIRKGETAILPVKILEDSGGQKLIEAELLLDREGISLRSSTRFDLNYRIAMLDISELRLGGDPALMPYIVLDGKSDFHGRPIQPRLKIYSHGASLPTGSQEASCTVTLAGRSCSTDIDIIFKLTSDWRLSG